MKYYLLYFFIPTFISSCQSGAWEKAEAYYKKDEYAKAVKYYKQIPKHKTGHIVYERLANSYRLLNDLTSSEFWFRKYFSTGISIDPENYILYGLTLKKNGKYKEAKNEFLKYKQTNHSDLVAEKLIRSCDSAMAWSKNQMGLTIVNLKKINSPFSDISPVEYNGGIVFSSSREGTVIRQKTSGTLEPFYNLYYSIAKENKSWSNPSSFSPMINTINHEAACCFNKDQNKIYFTRSTKNNEDSINRVKLFSSELKDNKWSQPEKFIFNDSSHSSYAHPSLSPDGKIFFFASDMPGGYGKSDIYACLNIGDAWTIPINLGPHINTPSNELFPFYHADGSLYFASDGQLGLGGFDLYQATQSNGEWNTIIHLKPPINSSADDFSIGLNEDKSKGYFSSNRPGGLGKEDIYMILFK